MLIYKSLIGSKIDYRCIVYNSTSSRKLKSLISVSNEAMRISNGSFKSTPRSSLQVITVDAPLQIKKYKVSLNYYYKVKSLLQNPAFKIITPEQEALCSNKSSPPQFAIKIQKINKIELTKQRCPARFLILLTRNQRPYLETSKY